MLGEGSPRNVFCFIVLSRLLNDITSCQASSVGSLAQRCPCSEHTLRLRFELLLDDIFHGFTHCLLYGLFHGHFNALLALLMIDGDVVLGLQDFFNDLFHDRTDSRDLFANSLSPSLASLIQASKHGGSTDFDVINQHPSIRALDELRQSLARI